MSLVGERWGGWGGDRNEEAELIARLQAQGSASEEGSLYMEVLNALNTYAALIQALTTVGLILVTIGLLWATAKMAKSSKETSEATRLLAVENLRLREDAKKPLVLATLQPKPEHGDFIQFVLKNLGRGSALNVRFRLEGDEEDFVRHEMMPLRGTAEPINFMSPGTSERYELGAARTLFMRPLMKPFPVVIEYEDVDGQPYEKRIVLDVKQFDGLAWPGASVEWRQMDALEKIAEHYKRN